MSARRNPAALRLDNLTLTHGRHPAVHHVSGRFVPGSLTAVVGPNGAGKTTLLRAVAGLIQADGEIAVLGTALRTLPLAERARRIAYLPQGHVFHWPLAVAEIVALGRLPRGAGADLSETDRAAVARAIAETGVGEFVERPVTTLSGGERARVALARVLATEGPLILADEPTASLDPRYQLAVIDILRRHAQNGGAVVAVLHDLALAARSADRVVVIDGGRIAADGPPRDVLTPARMTDVFGVEAEIVEVRGAPVIVPYSVAAR
jgi:iron complex transport system ATP-binding protein